MTRLNPLGSPARLLALLAATALLFLTSGPAYAADAALELDQATDLSPKGQTLTVTGSGYAPDTGLYLVTCDPAVPKGGACDMANFAQVKTDADGGFSSELHVVPAFGQTDCLKVPCAVQTSKIGDGADRSQEASAAVSFKGGVAAPTETPSPTTDTNQTDNTNKTDATDKDDAGSFPVVPVAVGAVVVLGVLGFVLSRRRSA